MCYAGGPYCYGDTYKRGAKLYKALNEKIMETRQAEAEAYKPGATEDDERRFLKLAGERDKLEESVSDVRNRLKGTREGLEDMQADHLLEKSESSRLFYESHRMERVHSMNDHEMRKVVAKETGRDVNDVPKGTYHKKNSPEATTLVYTDAQGKTHEKSYPNVSGEKFETVAGQLAEQSTGKPFNKSGASIISVNGRPFTVAGTFNGDGFGNVTFYADNGKVSVIVEKGKARNAGFQESLRLSDFPTAPGNSIAKKYSESLSTGSTPLAIKYQEYNKFNPDASPVEKEMRARYLYHNDKMMTMKKKGVHDKDILGTKELHLAKEALENYSRTEDYKIIKEKRGGI